MSSFGGVSPPPTEAKEKPGVPPATVPAVLCDVCRMPLCGAADIFTDAIPHWEKEAFVHELDVCGLDDVASYIATYPGAHRFSVIRLRPSVLGRTIAVVGNRQDATSSSDDADGTEDDVGAAFPSGSLAASVGAGAVAWFPRQRQPVRREWARTQRDGFDVTHTWFPGYAWKGVGCAVCRRFLGWAFAPHPPPPMAASLSASPVGDGDRDATAAPAAKRARDDAAEPAAPSSAASSAAEEGDKGEASDDDKTEEASESSETPRHARRVPAFVSLIVTHTADAAVPATPADFAVLRQARVTLRRAFRGVRRGTRQLLPVLRRVGGPAGLVAAQQLIAAHSDPQLALLMTDPATGVLRDFPLPAVAGGGSDDDETDENEETNDDEASGGDDETPSPPDGA